MEEAPPRNEDKALAALEAVGATGGAPELKNVEGVGVPGAEPKTLDVDLAGGKLGDEDGGTNEKPVPLLPGVPNPLNVLNLVSGGVPGV